MNNKNLKFKEGNRYLIKFKDSFSNNLTEIRVIEISKENRIKVAEKTTTDKDYYRWYNISDLELIEDLGIAVKILNLDISFDHETELNDCKLCKYLGLGDSGEISDGYHTFNELYRYRMLYNAAFFNELNNRLTNRLKFSVCKSYRHSDGELCFGGGWFIVVAKLPTGQITNHYKNEYWDLFKIPEVDKAPKWDGHTPNEAADRLEKYIISQEIK